ncbi:3,4-dihydroxy-2-butanone-4-phosphate synthase [Halorarius halobius]|uniref:3,4-dihydroxy-2-butanone-4-phosphate synthase n=1 Tax=Halorarius halobius TaxID=2962671 RepID=UPI0020CFCE76|nr:3,4-dihydroxy-2-butanone-4-phosphate synthase [Halorarius halobius]
MTDLDVAISQFEAGEPVLIHDSQDREGETDFVVAAESVTPRTVARMRNDAGGLICVAVPSHVADAFGLSFLHEKLDHPATKNDPEYDSRSSFSLSVNHRDTYTGITDNDRSHTITSLAAAARAPAETEFGAEFRVPGHVPVLRAAEGLLADRRGHTELSIALANVTDIAPAIVVCEMLDDESGQALAPEEAQRYAADHGYAFVEGRDIVNRFADRVPGVQER